MARPRTPIGTFARIYFETASGGRARAFARFRDHDGQLRRVQATAATQKAAERKLKELLAERAEQSVGQGELTASSSFRQLVDLWLADLDLEDKLPPSTRALYERNMEKLVVPAFENYTARDNSAQGRPVHQDPRGDEELQHPQAGQDSPQPRLGSCRAVRRAPRESGA